MNGVAPGPGARERGIALAAAAFALAALAAVLVGLWFAALQEYRVQANLVSDRHAFDAAEAGLAATVARWTPGSLNRLAVGDSAPFSGSLAGGTTAYAGIVLRLGTALFLIRSTGTNGAGSSRRTLATVVRLAPLRLGVEAALVSSGPVRIGAAALVDGLAADTDSTCAEATRPGAGVVLADTADLVLSECPSGTCLRGSPATDVDTALRGASVPVVGEEGWASLLAAADTIGPDGIPQPGAPVRFAPGDLSLPSEVPAAPLVLLVGGDLIVESGAQLTGLVLVRGRLIVRGAGGTIRGSALVGGADLSASGMGRASLVRAPCAVGRALAAAAPARALRERSWTALYQ
jgi:hypothetical protein